MTFEQMAAIIKKNRPSIDLDLLQLAYEFARDAHEGQVRQSGDPYIHHPMEAAVSLSKIEMDDATLIAAILHDVPEDTDRTIEDIENEFGEEIAGLVAGVTKLGKIKYRGIERYAENLRRMFMAMATDIRVILIKFGDRIHNLKTLKYLPAEKAQRIALESIEIYAPIADRLSMGEIKGQIEDLAFPYAYPDEYQWLIRRISPKRDKRKGMVDSILGDVEKVLKDAGQPVIDVHGRAKHLYSLYKKLLNHNRDISQIYDLAALRIIVPAVSDCYKTLGFLHEAYKPLKGRIKDYIAQPKPNGYQSLHTTCFTKDGGIIEFQIRTPEMHQQAEWGIAAHWHYKNANINRPALKEEKLRWVKQLNKLFEEVEDEKQILESLKLDIFQERIFVFTPDGDVIELPAGSTPVDFAYRIHSDIGDTCCGSKVNTKIQALTTILRNGDVVEIFTDKRRKGPNEDWLNYVKTSQAKHHIRQMVNRKKRTEQEFGNA